MNETQMDKEMFALAQFLVTSAKELEGEPKHYGSLRLIEALRRLTLLLEKYYDDTFMSQMAKKIEDNRALVMKSEANFYDFLEELVIEFAKEAKSKS